MDEGWYLQDPLIKTGGKTVIVPHYAANSIRLQTEAKEERNISAMHHLKIKEKDNAIVEQKAAIIQFEQDNKEEKDRSNRMENKIQNLSAQAEANEVLIQELRNELESKNTIYGLIIAAVSVISVVLMIGIFYVCISRKCEKYRMRRAHPLIDKRDGIMYQAQMKHMLAASNQLEQEKELRDPTAMGRFEPERFSDAINNLPMVQDVVLDGIIDEMETEEGINDTAKTCEK